MFLGKYLTASEQQYRDINQFFKSKICIDNLVNFYTFNNIMMGLLNMFKSLAVDYSVAEQ